MSQPRMIASHIGPHLACAGQVAGLLNEDADVPTPSKQRKTCCNGGDEVSFYNFGLTKEAFLSTLQGASFLTLLSPCEGDV